MKSGGPWNLRGLRPETRAAAREAARASGMSVGEWLNNVIQPANEDGDEAWWSADFDHEPNDRWRPRPREEDRENPRFRDPPPSRRREPEEERRQSLRNDDRERTRYRDPPPRRRRDVEPEDERRWSFRDDDRERGRYGGSPARRRDREPVEESRRSFRDDDRERGRYREPPDRRYRELEDQFHVNFRDDDRDRRNGNPIPRSHHNDDADERPVQRDARPFREPQGQGGSYRSEQQRADRRSEQQRADRARAERDRLEPGAANAAAEDIRDASIDKAVAEIMARQRVLDGEAAAAPAPGEQPQPFRPPPEPERVFAAWTDSEHGRKVDEGAVDISGLEQQLRQMTAQIELLRPSGDLEKAINGLRSDLSEIGRSLTEALPRRALESLEIEVKALGQRIDPGRQSGVDATALAGIERGLAEVCEALRGLTPAEGLVGFDEAVKGLAKKVDAIATKDDPAALQQLETAIGALRSIVSHVASNETLTKVAEDVRQLSAKVDGVAASGAGSPTLSALENRIDVLAAALNASAEAGHSVPRELEKLLSGLIEKLEWVQLTHTDRTALTHLEDRIATLVKRLDASDARLGLLEGVERGLADLLVYIEQLRGTHGAVAGVMSSVTAPVAVDAIEHEVAEIKQTERRIRDSLEDRQGTVERVVDRLAMIENDMRTDRVRAAPAELLTSTLDAPEPAAHESERAVLRAASDLSDIAPKLSHFEAAWPRSGTARTPIDPSLPPDHPLEPGSAAGRSRQPPSAADRIAASEAAIGSKPPVIADPGSGKTDFIAAARRAAQAAAASSDDRKIFGGGAARVAQPKKLTDRLRTLAVAAAVVVIVVGGYHIISRLLEDGSGAPSPAQAPEVQTAPQLPTEPPRTQTEPPTVQSEPRPAQKEPPHVEAEPLAPLTAPTANSTTAPMPPPDVGIAQPPVSSSPNSEPGATPGSGPGWQSQLNNNAAPDPMAPGPIPPDKEAGVQGSFGGLVAGAPLNITGSLPGASRSGGPQPTAGDKLPLAIGGPALRLAALAGDPAAAYEVAVRFAEGRRVAANTEEAARWFDIAAKKGFAPAQFRLGTFYEKGLGVKKDLATARDLYRAAADKGHGKAMHNLAVLYAEGADGKPDYRTAAQWFRKAADRGIADSQYNLAILYARGVGVEQNLGDSYKWFFLAAKEGDQDAAQKRDEIASRLDQHSLEMARAAAEKWTPLRQPADAVPVSGAWDVPVGGTPTATPKPHAAKASAPDAAGVN